MVLNIEAKNTVFVVAAAVEKSVVLRTLTVCSIKIHGSNAQLISEPFYRKQLNYPKIDNYSKKK